MTWYPIWAVRRFGWLEGLRRVAVFSIWPVLRGDPVRRAARGGQQVEATQEERMDLSADLAEWLRNSVCFCPHGFIGVTCHLCMRPTT